MTELEKTINYIFNEKSLLENALTHSSYANEAAGAMSSNERLEFLGDSILGFAAAKYLYSVKPAMPEGRMTRTRAALVCEHSLHAVALDIGLGKYLHMGKGEERTGGRERASILADATEALIAAIYLDGGMGAALTFISKYILNEKSIAAHHSVDYKTELQELVQRRPGQQISYAQTGEEGPDHNKRFWVQVSINGRVSGEGCGRTKKEAEQDAARAALEVLSR